jgi:phosphoserine aminotransferase
LESKENPMTTGAPIDTDVRRAYNFSAGPATLPEPVIRQAQEDLWSIAGSGIGILEHSHRGKVFTEVIEAAEADCRALAGLDDRHAVLFLQGGATLQFAMVPMSFLAKGRTADYLHTGEWTKKAIAEAKKFGDVHLAYDGTESKFDHAPESSEIRPSGDAVYTWYCSNNTIYGTEYATTPESSVPLICDASSDMFSRPIDASAHAMVIAGAQKNLGPAGCTLVIINRDLMERATEGLPVMLDYRKIAAKDSCLNTPPTFAIYIMGQVFKWIQSEGGLEAMAEHNQAKAKIVYDAIDASSGFYQAVARAGSRSLMNVTFRTPDADRDKAFVTEALANDMSGLKGHRSAGGLRASIYNAFPVEGCRALAQFMADFANRHG